ncbi:hypothetical protein GCM10023325_15150 [Sphingomonas lutea]
MTASNLGARITGYGFIVFLVGSIAWLTTGVMTNQPALMWTNVVLTALNIFGIWRWLGREARVEEGGEAAAQASRHTPGEALFPVSLLGKAVVDGQGGKLGQAIDAMAGCRSGRLAYVVVGEGGVAGVGETLRRLPWDRAHVDGERIVVAIDPSEFAKLDKLPKDQWPGR